MINGTVQDPRGAMIASAKVTERSLETNQSSVTTTDGEGLYSFPELRVGRYELKIEQIGFKTETQAATLTIGETAEIRIRLQVARTGASVDVTDSAPLVNTQTQQLSYLVGERAIRELPLNGRNYTDLALLQPGVTAYPQRDGVPGVQSFAGSALANNHPLTNSACRPFNGDNPDPATTCPILRSFGRILNTLTSARQIQLGLRISF